MKKSKKSPRGITLVALVITIVILLILAGISINLLSGEDGIIAKASKAVTETEISSAKEDLSLLVIEEKLEYYKDNPIGKDFIEYFYDKYKDGVKITSGATIFADKEEEYILVTYTNAKGKNIGEFSINKDGEVTLESVADSSGTIVDTNPPTVQALKSTTSSITFRATDRIGVVAWAITESETEPSEWTEVSSNKIYEDTKTGLENNKKYYIWAKDKAGNIGHTEKVTNNFAPIECEATQVGSNFNLKITSPEDTSYIFYKYGEDGTEQKYDGEFTEPSGDTVYFWMKDEAGNISTTKSVGLFASITISYNLNGGEGELPESIQTNHKQIVTLDTEKTLTKTGYTFLGWSTSATANEAVAEIEAEATDMVVYAVWKANSIYYFNNGDLCTDVSGGWTFGAVSYSNPYSNCAGSIGSTIHIYQQDATYNRYLTIATTNNIIDISKYSKMTMDIEFNTGNYDHSYVVVGLRNGQVTNNNSSAVLLPANSDASYRDSNGNTAYSELTLWSSREVPSTKSTKNVYNFYSMFGATLHSYTQGSHRETVTVDLKAIEQANKYYTTTYSGNSDNPKYGYNYLKGRLYFRVFGINYTNSPTYATSGKIYSIQFE